MSTSGHGTRSLLCSTAILSAFAFPAAVAAQEAANVSVNDTIDDAATHSILDGSSLVANDGPLDREGSGFGGGAEFNTPAFELEASGDQIVGTLALGYTRARANFTEPNPETLEQTVSNQHWRIGFEASVPFNGSEDKDVVDFRQIGNDAEARLSFIYYSNQSVESPHQEVGSGLVRAQCIVSAGNRAKAEVPSFAGDRDERIGLIDDYVSRITSAVFSRELYIEPEDAADAAAQNLAGREEFSAIAAQIRTACIKDSEGFTIGLRAVIRDYGPTAFANEELLGQLAPGLRDRVLASMAKRRSRLLFFGAEANIGYETHDVLDRISFALDEEDRVGIDSRLYAGAISGDGRSSVRVSVGYARGFEAEDAQQFCLPDPSGMGENCISGEDGEPTRTENTYVSLEGRLSFGRDAQGRPQFGIAPEVTYRVEDAEFLFDVPLYLVRQSDTGLSGGVRASFDTEDDDFSLRLFVGVPFSTWF